MELNNELLALFHCMSSLGAIFQLWEIQPGVEPHPITADHVCTAQAIFDVGKVTATVIASASIFQEKSDKKQSEGAKNILDSRGDVLPKMMVEALEALVATSANASRAPVGAVRLRFDQTRRRLIPRAPI